MMRCPNQTLVLFQYDGMIRAAGILVDASKEAAYDEKGVEYAGYYQFDVSTLKYLDVPIEKDELKAIYPEFIGFNQCKQNIPMEYLEEIVGLIFKNW